MGVHTRVRTASTAIAFASVVAAGAVLAAPANAALTEDLQIDNSALLGSVGENRYGAGCGYGVIATVNTDEPVQFTVTGTVPGSQTVTPNDNKAVFSWIPLLPGKYTITAKQGSSTKTTGELTVVQAVYTGSSCIIL
ncbi:hypothetical protein GTV32_02910 [Gordonia sp. SID5947]|uniref:hypothetical protein n=1 Tax=Gordonia sp. SID5947 TaxID=2690315 RepID=UPI00136C27BB|nr:hypothetical protein [Gordonia sp. SID5947]MYR05334.1 hypothetical protein [Gordonia sp. SID5947]